MNRDLLITLVFAGGQPETAYLSNNTHSLQEYIDALETDEYKQFSEDVNNNFIANADVRLVGQLFKIEKALLGLEPNDKNYPALLKNYTELLKLTAPIVERLHRESVEATTFPGLKLIIKGTEPEV